jgi:hypothetical protein
MLGSSRRVKPTENSDNVYIMLNNSFLLDQNMIGAVSQTTEFLCLTQNTAIVGYLNSYDVTCYDYDSYNHILWVGNSLGELFGYMVQFTPVSDQSKDKKERTKSSQESCASFRDSKQVLLTHISENTDASILKNVFYSISSVKGLLDFKSLFHYFFQLSSNGLIRTDSSLFECKTMLTGLTEEFMFTTEGSKLEIIRSSKLSNIVFTADSRCTITIWDAFDKCLLVRLHPPHFTQLILLQTTEDKRRIDFRKYLNKDFVSVQAPTGISVSPENEDFAVISQDYVSVYTGSGVLIATERTTNKQDRFTAVCIAKVGCVY